MSSDKRNEEIERDENKLLSQVGEDPRAGIKPKPMEDNNNDSQIAAEDDPTRSDE